MTPYNLVDDLPLFFLCWRGEVPAPFPEQTTSHKLDFRKTISRCIPIKSRKVLQNEFIYGEYTANYNEKCVLGMV